MSFKNTLLNGALLSGALAVFTPQSAVASDLLKTTDLGSGAELRSELLSQVPQMLSENSELELKCGEGKCGEEKKKEAKSEAAAETSESKTSEAKCGEGKCGEGESTEKKATTEESKTTEAKCGEGKCGEK